ncbi:MAG: hypothetical protein C4560_04965 [Nitrospiraceae bacterium]|nr:MAG: hypothetical protein C4560_04965 [Nitrospiraceae bacterium]
MTLSEYFHDNIYAKLFGKTWPKWIGGLLLAFLNILFFLYVMPLGGIYPAIADWGIWIYRLAGVNIEPPWGSLEVPWLSLTSVLTVGLIFGVFISALLSKQFKFRRDTRGGYIQAFLGGTLMGVGSFLAGACIIGGFYSSVMSLSFSGFYMMTGLIAGGYFGGKLMIWQGRRKAQKIVLDIKPVPKDPVRKEYKSSQPKYGVIALFIMFVIAAAYFFAGKNILGGVFLFSAVFGIVFQRSAFCITAAFREIFTTRSNEMMRSLMLSLMIGVTGFSIIKANGFRAADMFVLPAGLHSIAGGLLFGFGMVITGG